MGRAAETGALVGRAQMHTAAALEALGWSWGRRHRLGLDDDLGWWACRRGMGGWVIAGRLACMRALLACAGGRYARR